MVKCDVIVHAAKSGELCVVWRWGVGWKWWFVGHTSHVTRQTSHVKRHTSNATNNLDSNRWPSHNRTAASPTPASFLVNAFRWWEKLKYGEIILMNVSECGRNDSIDMYIMK